MGKSLLTGYRIAADVIDQLSPEVALLCDEHNRGEATASSLSPPAGGQTAAQVVSENAAHSPELKVQPGASELEVQEAAAESDDGLRVEKEGLSTLCTIGGRQYRLSGAKSIFVTNLRVNIRASQGKLSSHYDTIDLYSARARSSFALSLSRIWESEATRIEKDLVLVLEYLEKERDKELARNSRNEKHEVTEAEKKLGMELLTDSSLFKRIVDDLSSLGYVGEDVNKQLLYLCASSRKLDDPISVLILSQSASGKSYLVDCVKKLMPSEEVVAVTSLSDQALNYIESLSHKFLVLGEAVHNEVIEYQIREMLSGKELSRLVTVKDPDTGQMQSRVMRTPVIVSSVMSGTNHAVNPENSSRCFVVNTDESREQTERIHESQRKKYSLERLSSGGSRVEEIISRHQAAQRLLRKVHIVNEFAPHLSFPSSLMRLRRDHDRFLDLIACVCFLRQYQKEEESVKGLPFVRCDIEDYRIAYRIMVEGVLSSTLRELPKGSQLLYDELRSLAREEAGKEKLELYEVTFTQREIRERCGFGQTWVRENLRLLVDYEYVLVNRGGRERSKGVYRLKDDSDIGSLDISMIPTPEAMQACIRGPQ